MPASWDDATWKPGDDDPWAATEYRETSSPVPDYLNKQAPQDFSAFKYQYQPGDEKYRVGHPTADFGYGVARGLGKLAVGASRFGPGALIDQATGFSQRIEDMLPESSGTGLNKIGEIGAQMAVTTPLAIAGGAGLGATSVLGRMGVEAARSGALGAIANPDSPGAGLAGGAALGGVGQGVAEGFRALSPAAIAAMKRLYGTEGALASTTEKALPGVTPDAVAESLLNTGSRTGRGLRESAAGAYQQTGQDIMATANATPGKIPIEQILPTNRRLELALKSMESSDPTVTELAAGSKSFYTPGEAQTLKQHFSELGRKPDVAPELADLYREVAGRTTEQLRGAVPEYANLMQRSQLQQAAQSAAAGGMNPLASRIAGGAAGAAAGTAMHAVGIPPWVGWPAMIGAGIGRGQNLGEASLLSLMQAMRGASKLTRGVPFAQSAESTIPLWSYEEQQ